jgi:hypothetical protein
MNAARRIQLPLARVAISMGRKVMYSFIFPNASGMDIRWIVSVKPAPIIEASALKIILYVQCVT